ncbi:Uma2 family endonuclease [Tautonia rosea]|uniref:Uma2 family endonuclease n=1 Tax=Tautonia rosea TaxID=2728037 RepID=UPI0014733275|nr:Uma2 family endonuclease [Tautonia rosea]
MSQGTTLAPKPVADLPERMADDLHYEVIDGRMVELPPMSSRETYLASILVALLGLHARTSDLGRVVGEMLFKLDPNRNQKRRPDVAFVSFDRWPKARRVPASHGWEVVPELAIEVVSPTDAAVDLLEKVEEYFQTGVRRVWVVYPGSRCVYDYASVTAITVLRVSDQLDGGDFLPGLALSLADLFEVNQVDEEQENGEGTQANA